MLEEDGYASLLMQPGLCCTDHGGRHGVERAAAWPSDTGQSISAVVTCSPSPRLKVGWQRSVGDDTHGSSLKKAQD